MVTGDGYLDELAADYEAMDLQALENELVLVTRELAIAGRPDRQVIRAQLAVCEMVLERRRAGEPPGG
jgi:hypothetical protein